jgi:hypothetical protein
MRTTAWEALLDILEPGDIQELRSRGLAVVWADELPKVARFAKTGGRPPHATRIVSAVALHYGLTVDHLASQDRRPHVVLARRVAVYLLRLLSCSYPLIADILKRRDHTGVLQQHRKFRETLQQDRALAAEVEALAKEILPKGRNHDPR